MTKDEMIAEFDVLGFVAYGIYVVRRKSDGVRGTLDFADDHAAGQRYFGFLPE